MKQLLPYVIPTVGWATATHAYRVMGAPIYSIFGLQSLHAIPLPWPATFRNLTLISRQSGHPTTALTLMKDAGATALAVTLPSTSDGPVKNTADEATFAALDDCWWRFQLTAGPGHTFATCVEVESQGNIFGIGSSGGSAGVGPVAVGGALGNGFWQPYTSSASSSRSICAVAGSITHLAARTYATPPAIGAGWMALIRLNGVEQDGSGATVDTRCFIVGDGATDRALATFDLPIVPGDIVEVVYYRTGAVHPNEPGGQVAVGVGFVPTVAGQYMLTGGSNTSLGTIAGLTTVWTFPDGSQTSEESLSLAPIGPGGISIRGAYIEAQAPGSDPDDEVTWTLRRSGADTDVAIVLQQFTGSGLITGLSVPFAEDSTIGWRGLETGGSSPNMARLFWGLAAVTPADAPEPPGRGCIGPHQWIKFPRTRVEAST